jgi:Uncharacterized protein conserved in bacteria
MSASYLRCQLFVDDIDSTVEFYTKALGFKVLQMLPDGYTSFANGNVVIAASQIDSAATRDSLMGQTNRASGPKGRGLELILEVADVDEFFSRVLGGSWSGVEPLEERPWGLRDFRITDPDGYYWRVTSVDYEHPHSE